LNQQGVSIVDVILREPPKLGHVGAKNMYIVPNSASYCTSMTLPLFHMTTCRICTGFDVLASSWTRFRKQAQKEEQNGYKIRRFG
jgi:hypothetical protein